MIKSSLKSRKLYQVRVYCGAITRQVGRKGRLLPRAAAVRVAQRLRRSGLFVTVDPMMINLTPLQSSAMDRRHKKIAPAAFASL